jgi:uncharacterized iron-regulated membrane protein
MTPLKGLRRFWLTVHLWLGVGLLVALIPLSVTGSALVWHDQIDRVLYAQRYAVTGARVAEPIKAYADAAQAAFGTRVILTQVRLPQKAGDPVVAVLGHVRIVGDRPLALMAQARRQFGRNGA